MRDGGFCRIRYAIRREHRGLTNEAARVRALWAMVDSDGVTAPADAADDAPAPTSTPTSTPTWRIGPVAVATGLAASVLIHLALLGTALFISPLLGRPAPVYSVPVELVTAEQVAQEKPSAKPDKPDDSTEPNPQAQTHAEAQPPPPGGPASTASPARASPALPVDGFSLPSPPASRQAAASAPPSGQAEQLAKLIGLPVAGPSGGGPSDYQADLTRDQIAAFASHLQSCWTSSAEIADDPRLYVVIRVSLRRDGSLAANPEVVAGSASMSALALKQSAVNALKHCPAYGDLPPDKYDQWRLLDLRFTPSGISTATPVTGAQRAPPRPG